MTKDVDSRPVLIAPSILAADFSRLGDEIRRAEIAGADWLHLDVMDGNFVDNISFGPMVCETVKKASSLPTDVHLMIQRPDHYFPRFVGSASNITVHVESSHNVATTLEGIRAAGCTAGLSLNPATPFEQVEPYLESIDLLLVMTVVPGFGGQSFMPEMMAKVKAAAEFRSRHGLDFRIEVDGGINAETGRICVQNGADVLVAGTYLFHSPAIAESVSLLRSLRTE